jgi:hypothetical protein
VIESLIVQKMMMKQLHVSSFYNGEGCGEEKKVRGARENFQKLRAYSGNFSM